MHDQQFQIGVFQYPLQLFAFEPRVKNHGDRADLLRSKVAERDRRRVGQEHADTITLTDTFLLQMSCQSVHAPIERGERQFFFLGDDRGFLRLTLRRRR